MSRRVWFSLFLGLVGLGIVFRLIFPEAIEFKADEAQMLNLVLDFHQTRHLDFLGLSSSGGLNHPGFGNWIFILLGDLFGVQTPVGLARITGIFNSIALVILVWFVEKRLDDERWKESWRWGILGFALNPFQVIIGRKIWTSSLFTPFFALMLCFWVKRKESKTSAFFWGFLGALVAQVHLAGVYPVFAIFLWSARDDLKKGPRRVSWEAWFSGSLLGAVSLIPWVLSLQRMSHESEPHFKWYRLFMAKFWNFWVSTGQGWVVHANIGGDLFHLCSNYLFSVALGISFIFTALSVFFLIRGLVRLKGFWGEASDSDLLIQAVLVGQGLLMSLCFININNYYLVAFFPLPVVWFAKKILDFSANWKRGLLVAWVGGQLVMTLFVLNWIHTTPHVEGDFGTPYWALLKR